MLDKIKSILKKRVSIHENITHIYDSKSKTFDEVTQSLEIYEHRHMWIDKYIFRKKDTNMNTLQNMYKRQLLELSLFLEDTNYFVLPTGGFYDDNYTVKIHAIEGTNAKKVNSLSLYDKSIVVKFHKNLVRVYEEEEFKLLFVKVKEND